MRPHALLKSADAAASQKPGSLKKWPTQKPQFLRRPSFSRQGPPFSRHPCHSSGKMGRLFLASTRAYHRSGWTTEMAGPKKATKCPKRAHDGPMVTQSGPKVAPAGPEAGPRWPQSTPREPKMAPRWPEITPKWSQEAPKWPQEGHETPQEKPRWPQGGPKWPQSGPEMPRDSTKEFQGACEMAARRPQSIYERCRQQFESKPIK